MENLTFPESIERVKSMSGIAIKPPEPVRDEIDRDTWQQAARNFINECFENLKKPDISMEWLYHRGLTDKTLEFWHIGINKETKFIPAEKWGMTGKDICIPAGVVIPCHSDTIKYIKIRKLPCREGVNKYHILRGSHGFLYGGNSCQDALSAFLHESELDALLGWQHLPGAGHISIPAGQPMKDEYLPLLKNVEDIVICYDADQPGQEAAEKLSKLKNFHIADPFPVGKDLTEYSQAGGNALDYLYCQLAKIPSGIF
jgi:hypothetical protein